jgi:hypothetical protein
MDAYSLGQNLQQARAARELSLEDVKAKTRIATHILEAFEQGTFILPDLSPVQVRGMLTNYAGFLNLDVEEVQAAYNDILNPPKRRRRPNPTPPRRPDADPNRPRTEARRPAYEDNRPATSSRRYDADARPSTEARRPASQSARQRPTRRGGGSNLLNILVIFTLALASIAIIAVIITQLLRQPEQPDGGDIPDLPIGLADLPPTATFTNAPTRVYLRTPTLIPRTPQNYQGEPVLVTIQIQQRAWVSVTADGAQLFNNLARSGMTLEYRGINDVVVTSSNAAALLVTYNGQPQASYGGRGQEVVVTFRPGNDITIQAGPGFAPTSEFTATLQNTSVPLAATLLAEQTPSMTPGPSPTPSDTPPPSPTLEFSPTPSETPSATPTITPTATASITPTATETLPPTATPSPTAIVPPRFTPVGATPEKP